MPQTFVYGSFCIMINQVPVCGISQYIVIPSSESIAMLYRDNFLLHRVPDQSNDLQV